jgi:hypothetical protein
VLALTMARALSQADPLQLYPAAFGVLVLSKAYSVTRSAMVPRLLPRALSLVKANARLNVAALVAGTLAVGLGGAVNYVFGPDWVLRFAATFFLVAAGFTLAIPPEVDSPEDETVPVGRLAYSSWWVRLLPQALGPVAGPALWAASSLRWLNGFLTIFLAFLARHTGGLGGLGSNATLGAVIGAAAVGGFCGSLLGARLSRRAPQALIALSLSLAAAAAVAAAVLFSLPTVLILAGTTGITQSLSKLALDSLIQREIPYVVRSAAFARSESTLQFFWVVGGAVGIGLPMDGRIGLAVATAVVLAALLYFLGETRRQRAPRPLLTGG